MDENGSDVHTLNLSDIILYHLESREISQTSFAQYVVSRTQGTLSDLLNNPKPWKDLRSGRETYQQMIRWLQLSFDKQQMVLDGLIPEGWVPAKPMGKKDVQNRGFVFSDEQKAILEAYTDRFGWKPCPKTMRMLADKMGIDNVTPVKNWFCNARKRLNQMQ